VGIRHLSTRMGLVAVLLVAFVAALAGAAPGVARVMPVASADASGWHAQSTALPNHNLTDVSFVDASHGWAVGYAEDLPLDEGNLRGVILATTDGGLTWSPQNPPAGTSQFQGVSFVDASHGWVVGGLTMLATADGGVTWAPQGLPADIVSNHGSLHAVTFTDADHGWAVGNDWESGAFIAATSDGGAHWAAQNPPAGVTELQGVSFVDANRGWAVGWTESEVTIIATTDGGASWNAQNVPSGLDTLFSVSAVDGNHCWVGGTNAILATANGGTTWAEQSAKDASLQEQGICFIDTTHGWAVGTDGILATSDGGTTWSPQRVPPEGEGVLHSVTATDATHAWAVGVVDYGTAQERGVVLRTTNGGAAPVQTPPRITKLTPASAKRGALVVITGTDFGTVRGASTVRFGSTKCARYASWGDTLVKCRVPAKAKYGKVTVTVTTTAGKSNVVSFTVKR